MRIGRREYPECVAASCGLVAWSTQYLFHRGGLQAPLEFESLRGSGIDTTGPRHSDSQLDRSSFISRTAFVSTYPPRRCALATFTYDLATTVGEREIMALHPSDEAGPYPPEVRHRIRRDIQADYAQAALILNDRGVSVVSLQHDFGVWGGDDGAWVLDFVRALRIPSVVTLHSVLPNPTPAQRQVVRELIAAANATVVMSRAAVSSLKTAYGVDPARAEVVPHGVPDLPLVAPDAVKPRLGLAGRAVILSFGLLGPGKGYETAIAAMPAIVEAVPSACYVILGATYPGRHGAESEAYRAALEAQVAALGLAANVRFVDRFVGRVELGTWLESADVLVTPYPNLDRTVSGALAYGMAAGRPVISTPYAYASEMLGDGRGILVDPESPAQLAEATTRLLLDAESRSAIGRRAHERSRPMVWWQVGHQYRRVFDRVARSATGNPAASGRAVASVVA